MAFEKNMTMFSLEYHPVPETHACENKDLKLSCGSGKELHIISANYGRRVSIPWKQKNDLENTEILMWIILNLKGYFKDLIF